MLTVDGINALREASNQGLLHSYEKDIDGYLAEKWKSGKTVEIVIASCADFIEPLAERYRTAGWEVSVQPLGRASCKLHFQEAGS